MCPCVFGGGRGLELLLQSEREAFRLATVKPVHQLRDDLCFRLGEVQHKQLSEHPSNWEQVIQQVWNEDTPERSLLTPVTLCTKA